MNCEKCNKDLSEGFTDDEVVVWCNKPNEPRVPWKVICKDCRDKDKLKQLQNQRNKLNRKIASLKKVNQNKEKLMNIRKIAREINDLSGSNIYIYLDNKEDKFIEKSCGVFYLKENVSTPIKNNDLKDVLDDELNRLVTYQDDYCFRISEILAVKNLN